MSNAERLLRLHENEHLLETFRPAPGIVWPNLLFSCGIYELWRRMTIYAVTSERVILRKGIFSRVERSIPLAMVQDATVATVLWMGQVAVSTAGGALSVVRFNNLAPGTARRLADAIMRQAGTVRGQRPIAQDGSADVYEALRQLAQLRDSGVITAEEFETKKAELLRRL